MPHLRVSGGRLDDLHAVRRRLSGREYLTAVEVSLREAIDEEGRGSAEIRTRLDHGAVKQTLAVEKVVLGVEDRVPESSSSYGRL